MHAFLYTTSPCKFEKQNVFYLVSNGRKFPVHTDKLTGPDKTLCIETTYSVT